MTELLALQGSPHRGGFTGKLLDAFLSRAPAGARVRRFDLYEEDIRPCNGCGSCEKVFGCAIKKNQEIFNTLERSDALVIATPVYLLSFPAPMKALFDRFQQYYCARFRLGLKPAIPVRRKVFLLITQGSENPAGWQTVRLQCETALSVMNAEICGTYVFEGTDRASEAEVSRAIKEVSGAADRYFARFGPCPD